MLKPQEIDERIFAGTIAGQTGQLGVRTKHEYVIEQAVSVSCGMVKQYLLIISRLSGSDNGFQL